MCSRTPRGLKKLERGGSGRGDRADKAEDGKGSSGEKGEDVGGIGEEGEHERTVSAEFEENSTDAARSMVCPSGQLRASRLKQDTGTHLYGQ